MTEKIERELDQRKFRNEKHKAVVNLVYTYNMISERLQEIFSRENLTMQQFNILRILRGNHPEPCTNSHVKERMLDKNSDVTRIVDRLIKRGLVERCSSEKDRRKVAISITAKGLEALSRLDDYKHQEDAIMDNLTDEQVALLNSLLDELRG